MKALKEICRSNGEYVEMIKDASFVKNAVSLLRKRQIEEEIEDEEGGKKEERGKKESKGMEIEGREMDVGEKASLIELLTELVRRGVKMREEEELKEVLMDLEEEGNRHIEEEIDREEGKEEKGGKKEKDKEEEGKEEEVEEERREWEELSESACLLVRMMEKMKRGREGKGSMSLKMKRQKEVELEEKAKEERRGREEDKRRREECNERMEEERKRRDEERKELEEQIKKASGELDRLKEEDPHLKEMVSINASIRSLTLHHSHPQSIEVKGNRLSRKSSGANVFCSTIVGDPLSSVCITHHLAYIDIYLSLNQYCHSIGSISDVSIHPSLPPSPSRSLSLSLCCLLPPFYSFSDNSVALNVSLPVVVW